MQSGHCPVRLYRSQALVPTCQFFENIAEDTETPITPSGSVGRLRRRNQKLPLVEVTTPLA